MYFSLSETAKKVGMARSSIYRLIDEGKLSASVDRKGKKVVELSELLRVFGSIGQETVSGQEQRENRSHKPRKQSQDKQDTQDNITSMVIELEKLRAELRVKDSELRFKDRELSLTQERLEDAKKVAEIAQKDKEQLLQIVQNQTLLLEAPKAKAEPLQTQQDDQVAQPKTKKSKKQKRDKKTGRFV